ncbi:MAG TPA: GyrI-like domain-containing protein [Bryobacteraceae bacterium]|jgi:effector-binding domain-containing protein|nr:GyrI-like domain-containing protein [Bryobacteraceae bacterium]
MNLTLEPETVSWPEADYVFLERVGPFSSTASQAWQDLHRLEPAISKHNQITGAMALYKIGPQIYRAGFLLAAPPQELPPDLQHTRFAGGQYTRFVMTGAYSNLPEASGRVWSIVAERRIPVRDDFAIENYVNNPKTTAEEQLITEILVPTL